MQLDLKDRKILAELDLNARETYQTIGRKVGLSKETTINRIKNLEKREIIQRYTTLVNFGKLGFTGYVVYNRFQNITKTTKEELIKYISNIPENYWIAIVGGKFDLVFGLMCKNIIQFNKLYYDILNKFGNYLDDSTIGIRTELRQHKRSYLINEKEKEFIAPSFGGEQKIETIDNLDQEILSELSNSSRVPTVNLAKKLHKPVSTIAFRIKQLEKREIIQGYTTYIKTQNFGMQSYRLLLYLQNINEKTRNQLFEYVNSNPKTILAIENVGVWNFEITLEVKDHKELQEEMEKIRNKFKTIIKNIEFLIMFEDDLVYNPYPLLKQKITYLK